MDSGNINLVNLKHVFQNITEHLKDQVQSDTETAHAKTKVLYTVGPECRRQQYLYTSVHQYISTSAHQYISTCILVILCCMLDICIILIRIYMLKLLDIVSYSGTNSVVCPSSF